MSDKTQNKIPNKVAVAPKGYEQKRCYFCHRARFCSYRADPYLSEIRGDRTKHWSCDECDNNNRGEV